MQKNTDSFNNTFFLVKMKLPNMKKILLKLQLISWSGKNEGVSVK